MVTIFTSDFQINAECMDFDSVKEAIEFTLTALPQTDNHIYVIATNEETAAIVFKGKIFRDVMSFFGQ